MTDLANRDQALKLEWDKQTGDDAVEIVARALAGRSWEKCGNEDARAEFMERRWPHYVEDARAVIEALRPTAIEYGRRVLALAESKEALVKRLGG